MVTPKLWAFSAYGSESESEFESESDEGTSMVVCHVAADDGDASLGLHLSGEEVEPSESLINQDPPLPVLLNRCRYCTD
jgi:hypothetical protein